MDKSIKRNLQIIKEERERKQISISIVESRLSTIMGGEDFFVRYNSLSENKKVKLSFYILKELNTIVEYDLISEQDLSSTFKNLFGTLFTSGFETILEPVVRFVLEKVGMEPKSFMTNTVVSLLTTNPMRVIEAMTSCQKFSKLMSEVLSEAFVMEIQQSVGGEGQVMNFLRNSIGGAVKDTKFVEALTNQISSKVCTIFSTLFKNAKNLMGQTIPSGS